jgi:DNA polymerase-1
MFQKDPGLITDNERQVGKTQNFAVLYGAGEMKIAQVARSTERRALEMIQNYYEEFSELNPWKRRLLKQARERGDRSDPFFKPPYVSIPPIGRRRRLPDLYSLDKKLVARAERQAINAYVQGFASNIAKIAMLNLHAALKPYPAKMLLQVHDEVIVRVHKSAADEVMNVMTETMSGVHDLVDETVPILWDIPLVVSAAMGDTWAQAKGK